MRHHILSLTLLLSACAPDNGIGVDPHGTAVFRITNDTGAPVFVQSDAQLKLQWLEIGTPARRLNGYGGTICGTSLHNDPFFRAERLAAGATVEHAWSGETFELDGDCWRVSQLPAGEYPVRYCAYETAPPSPNLPVVPTPPTRCASGTLSMPADGRVVVELHLER